MTAIDQAIKAQIHDLALAFLLPFVEFAISNPDMFEGDDLNRQEICSKMIKELKLEIKSEAKTKISDALKGMGASKTSGTRTKGKSTKKEEDQWMTKDDFINFVESNPNEDFCSYTPPRGKNKDLFCGRVANVKNSENTNDSSLYRCESCKSKAGRGKKLLANDGDAPTKSIKRNPILGITKRKPADRKNNKKDDSDSEKSSEEDSDSESSAELELTPNKTLTKLIGKNYYLYDLPNVGVCLVTLKGEDNIIVYGKFESDVTAATTITPKMLKELSNIKESKINKKGLDSFTFMKTSDLDLSGLKKTEDESPKKDKKSKKQEDESSEEETKKEKKSKKVEEKKSKKMEESSEEETKKEKKTKKVEEKKSKKQEDESSDEGIVTKTSSKKVVAESSDEEIVTKTSSKKVVAESPDEEIVTKRQPVSPTSEPSPVKNPTSPEE